MTQAQADQIKKIVSAIIADLSARGGLGDEWDRIDAETKAEIRSAWAQIVADNSP